MSRHGTQTIMAPKEKAKKGKAQPAKKSAISTIKSMILGDPKAAPAKSAKAKGPVPPTKPAKVEAKGSVKAPQAVKGATKKGAPVADKKEAASKIPGKAGKKGKAPTEEAPEDELLLLEEDDDLVEPDPDAEIAEMELTAAQRREYARPSDKDDLVCREIACESGATAKGYCRLHYIKNWRKIKRKETILKEGKLNQYIEELVSKYPDKYIEAIRQDLASDKDFAKVIADLDLDTDMDDFEMDAESIDTLIDGIRRDMDEDDDVI